MVPYLYSVARKVSYNLYIPGYEKEDLVQECVTETFALLSADSFIAYMVKNQRSFYISQIMRFHLYNIMRRKEPMYAAVEYVDIIHVPSHLPVTIPIPLSNETARHIVIALLENDFQLQQAADDLGISCRVARRRWEKARRLLRSPDKRVSMLPQETYSLIEKEHYGNGNSDSNRAGGLSST